MGKGSPLDSQKLVKLKDSIALKCDVQRVKHEEALVLYSVQCMMVFYLEIFIVSEGRAMERAKHSFLLCPILYHVL